MHGGIGVNTLDDAYFAKSGLPVSLRDEFLAGLLRLRARPVDILLASHPDQTRMLDKVAQISPSCNPFVDATAWPALMDARIAMVKKLIA
jgi:metallo-beta-lactamase class B